MRLLISLAVLAAVAACAGCNRDPGGAGAAAKPASSKQSPAQPPSATQAPSSPSPVVIFRGADGRALTLDDLQGFSGSFSYEIVGKSNVSAEAELLHKQAREAGVAGDAAKAMALFDQASNLAPQWPYPIYDKAFTYLLMSDNDNARRYYAKAVELAPRGFFTAITALDTLDREAKGELPQGTYRSYLALEWASDQTVKAQAAIQLAKRAPGFAPAWKELAMLADSDPDKLTAIEKGLAANPDAETKGILLINKALIADRGGDRAGAIQLLGELALDPASTYATEHLAKATLATMAKQ
ncbi:tetratricopeptide repeat protein [Pseudomonas sp. CGJS7]|uniref:tetratricopeptide repeat protein n=1 Tax=Pseudomonas sp. CGJS7 TaxID=3109348 RepID=UPI00300A357C